MKNIKGINGTIGLLKFIFAISIAIYHFNLYSETGGWLFQLGNRATEFFFIASGYLLASKAIDKSNSKNIFKDDIKYVTKKYLKLLPYILIAYILTFITYNLIGFRYTIGEIISSIWNILPFEMLGIKTNIILIQQWFISALLISILILYPLINKYKDKFIKYISPFIVLLLGIFMLYKYNGDIGQVRNWTGICCGGLLRGFLEMNFGIIAYFITEKIKKHSFDKKSNIYFTILEIILIISVIILLCLPFYPYYTECIILLAFTTIIILAFSEKTYFYNNMNNKVNTYLGKLSISIFFNNFWIAQLLNLYIKKGNYFSRLFIYMISLLIISIVITFVIDKLNNKIYSINKDNIKV